MVSVMSFVDQFVSYLWIMLLLVIVATIIIVVFFRRQFKHGVTVREIVQGRTVVYHDKAREFKDKEGALFWQLWKTRDLLPLPPPEAIDLTTRGKKHVEVYRTETGEYIYCRDDPTGIRSFQPLTTKQRLILIKQLQKAHSRVRKSWQDYILPVAGISALVIVIVALMIFYEDMARPLITMADKQIKWEEVNQENLNIMKEIKQDLQIIKDDMGVKEKPPPPS